LGSGQEDNVDVDAIQNNTTLVTFVRRRTCTLCYCVVYWSLVNQTHISHNYYNSKKTSTMKNNQKP
jgi:competence transcription factor ComK